jgi:mannose-1-phosphate guanylyltransferase/mannose-6-phosphate isomerase
LAALSALQDGQDPVLIVTPADQTIAKPAAFTAAVQQAISQAELGHIVIFGVTPDKPETGYGYIRTDQSSSAPLRKMLLQVISFVEKPNQATAEGYMQEGGYYWNAGLFVLKASVWLAAIEQFSPAILQATRTAWAARKTDGAYVRPGKAEFEAIPSESVDYAVMEHCPGSAFSIQMALLDAGWSDLGAWDAVWNLQPKDAQGNSHVGDVLHTDSHNTLVQARSRLVALVGVSDLVVVETADAVLVASKSRSQDIKGILNQLTAQKREEQILHRKVHRPWGWYDIIDEGSRFKVKRIQVKPNASLSLQKHHHRAEHWIVVTGTAEITKGDKVLTLTENQSTYIPLGEVHRLANPGTIPLEIIEVQSGSYLGEDDIVRFEDTYGRATG